MDASVGSQVGTSGAGALVLCRPSQECERLIAEMERRGTRVEVRCLDWAIEAPVGTVDFALFLIAGHAYGVQEALRRRVDELRALLPDLPALTLVQDARTDLRHLSDAGLSNFIVGFPWDGTAADFLSRLGARRPPLPLPGAKPRLPEREGLVFTAREAQTIDRLRCGMQNKTIANDLGISTRTVKAYVRSILAKLRVSTRSEAIAMLAKYDLPEAPGAFPRTFPFEVKSGAPAARDRLC